MKVTTKIFFLVCYLCTFKSFGQVSHAQNTFDSSFTLPRYIRQDKLAIGQHGIAFYSPEKKTATTNQVTKDFNQIEALSSVDLTQYQKRIVTDSNHLIKIWTANNDSENILKVIEVNSIYFIDITEENEPRLKDTVVYNNYFIQLRNTIKNVWYETINELGVNKYSIANREVLTNRELVPAGLFNIDNTRQITELLRKYNSAQQ